MIYVPSKHKSEEIGTLLEQYAEDFFLYYHNFSRIITSNGLVDGASLDDLSDTAYMNYVEWNANNAVIYINYVTPVKIRSLILGNPSFNSLTGGLYLNGELVHKIEYNLLKAAIFPHRKDILVVTEDNKNIVVWQNERKIEKKVTRLENGDAGKVSSIDQKLWILDFPKDYTVNEVRISLTGDTKGHLNYLYIGDRLGIMRPAKIDKYTFTSYGQGKLSDVRVAYGKKMRPFRSFSASWDLVSDRTRLQVEEYMTEVQNVVPHVIRPMQHSEEYIPPMYGILTTEELKNGLDTPHWLWKEGTLDWIETA